MSGPDDANWVASVVSASADTSPARSYISDSEKEALMTTDLPPTTNATAASNFIDRLNRTYTSWDQGILK